MRFKHPYDRGIRQNFEEVFGAYPWYLALLPSVREPPVVVFPPMPELFPHTQFAAHEAVPEEAEYHEQVMFNNHHQGNLSAVGSAAGAPRWERNIGDDAEVDEEDQTLITDRPHDSNQGITPRSMGASSSRKVEHISAYDDKSK